MKVFYTIDTPGTLIDVEELIAEGQMREEHADCVLQLKHRRDELRQILKQMCNKQFGSSFRTFSHRTMVCVGL